MPQMPNTQTPSVRPVAIQDLRLGDCLITPLPNGRHAESIVWYLGQELEQTGESVGWRYTFGVAPRRVALDRILNPHNYALKPPPLAPHLIDLSETERLAMQRNPDGYVRVASRSRPAPPPPLLRATDRSKLLLNGVDDARLQERGLDPQTLRHAAQALRPDACVAVESQKIKGLRMVKAVGFGIGGPLGVLCFLTAINFTDKALLRKGAWQIMPDDCWLDTRRAIVTTVDPQRNHATLKNFDNMKRVQIPYA